MIFCPSDPNRLNIFCGTNLSMCSAIVVVVVMRCRWVKRSKARGRGVGRWCHWYAKYVDSPSTREHKGSVCIYTQKHFHVDGPSVRSNQGKIPNSRLQINVWRHSGFTHWCELSYSRQRWRCIPPLHSTCCWKCKKQREEELCVNNS